MLSNDYLKVKIFKVSESFWIGSTPILTVHLHFLLVLFKDVFYFGLFLLLLKCCNFFFMVQVVKLVPPEVLQRTLPDTVPGLIMVRCGLLVVSKIAFLQILFAVAVSHLLWSTTVLIALNIYTLCDICGTAII